MKEVPNTRISLIDGLSSHDRKSGQRSVSKLKFDDLAYPLTCLVACLYPVHSLLCFSRFYPKLINARNLKIIE